MMWYTRCVTMRTLLTRFKQFAFRHQFLFSFFLFVVFSVAFTPTPTYASQVGEIVTSIFGTVIGEWYVPFMGKLMAIIANGIIIVAGYNGFADATAVQVGWVLTRDIANMFFVVALLMMAFGTMFNIEKLGTLHHLPHIVIFAIAINFSKTLVLFLIDIAQVFMLTFVTAFQNSAAGNFVKAFGITDWFTLVGQTTPESASAVTTAIFGYILSAILVTVATFILATFFFYLIHRFVYLWILIILAPLAFGVAVLGDKGHHHYAHWWDELIKTIIAGPVLAFFLWLTLLIAGSAIGGSIGSEVLSGSVSGTVDANQQTEITSLQSKAFSVDVIITFIVSIVLLMLGLHVTEEISGGAFKGGKSNAKWVSGIASGAATWAGYKALGAGWGATKMVGKGVGAVTGVNTAVKYAKSGVTQGVKSIKSSGFGKAMGWDEDYNKVKQAQIDARVLRAFGKDDKARLVEQEAISGLRKNLDGLTAPQIKQKLDNLRQSGDTSSLTYKATAMSLAEKGFFNANHSALDQAAGTDVEFQNDLIAGANKAGANYVKVKGGDKNASVANKMAGMSSNDINSMFANIDKQSMVGRDLDGNEVVGDQLAAYKLANLSESQFKDMKSDTLKQKVKDGILLSLKNIKGDGVEQQNLRNKLAANYNNFSGLSGAPGALQINAATGAITGGDPSVITRNETVSQNQSKTLADSYTAEVRKPKGNVSTVDARISTAINSMGIGAPRRETVQKLSGLQLSSRSLSGNQSANKFDEERTRIEQLQNELEQKYASLGGSTGLRDESGAELSFGQAFKGGTMNKSIEDLKQALSKRQGSTDANEQRQLDTYIASLQKQISALAQDSKLGRSSSSATSRRAGYDKTNEKMKNVDRVVSSYMNQARGSSDSKEKLRAMKAAFNQMKDVVGAYNKQIDDGSGGSAIPQGTRQKIQELKAKMAALKPQLNSKYNASQVSELENLNKEFENLRRELT